MSDATSIASKLIRAEDYANQYLVDMEFEKHLIWARQGNCLDYLQRFSPRTVAEIGCGPDLLVERFDLAASPIEQWLAVEPSFYADRIERLSTCIPKLAIERGYLEERMPEIERRFPDRFDAVLLSGLLHETTNPDAMLDAAFQLVASGGTILVSVPNALSFHRLLAVEMGLIQTPTELSLRNINLGQPTVFQRSTLEAVIRRAGFTDLQFSGYMFKPFSNEQMRQIVSIVGESVVDGLIRLGKLVPDHAAEISIIARKS